MNLIYNYLDEALRVVALGQATVAFLNLKLVGIMKWHDDLAAMPLLIREVFQVHKWFISITLWIFAAVTFCFADRFAAGDDALVRTLAGGIALFWGIRTYIQIGYYSGSHWHGIPSRTAVHIILFLAYLLLTLTYGISALGGRSLAGGLAL